MPILSLVTDNNPSWMNQRKENDRWNYFMINLHDSMGPGGDRSRDPWICSHTRYRLCYAARFLSVLIWVQIVYKGYQQTTKVAACKERVNWFCIVFWCTECFEYLCESIIYHFHAVSRIKIGLGPKLTLSLPVTSFAVYGIANTIS